MFPPSSARGIGDEGDIFSANSPLEPRDSGSLPPQFPFHGYSTAGAESSSSARSGIDIPSTRHFSFMEGSRDSRDSGFGSRQMASSLPIQEDPVSSSSSSSSTRRELDIAVSATPFLMCGIPGGFYHDDTMQHIFKRGETPQEVQHLGILRKSPASFAAAPMSTLFS